MSGGIVNTDRSVVSSLPPSAKEPNWSKVVVRVNSHNENYWKRYLVPRLAWLDALVLIALLFISNSFLAPHDIGWLQVQPSPYFLVPVLIGCRYGFTGGVISGLLCGLIALVANSGWDAGRFGAALNLHGYFFGALMFIGGICGEIQHAYRKKELQLASLNDHLGDRLKNLDAELSLLSEAKAELERMLATRDAELSTLDVEIRRLFESHKEELYQNILLLLNRYARISGAGLYVVEERSRLFRKAILGPADLLPEQANWSDVEMVALAMKHKTVVTIPEFWQRPPEQHQNYLIAAPLVVSNDKVLGVLLVTRMPFIALQEKTVHLVTLICRWAARVMELRRDAPAAYRAANGTHHERIFSLGFFRHNLELSYTSYRQHNLPSAVLVFTLAQPAPEDQHRLEEIILPSIRGADFPAQLELPLPNLAVLLPFSGERGARISIQRILSQWKRNSKSQLDARLLTFEGKHDFDLLWQEVTAYGPKDPAAQ
jgi:hypothetical protein